MIKTMLLIFKCATKCLVVSDLNKDFFFLIKISNLLKKLEFPSSFILSREKTTIVKTKLKQQSNNDQNPAL